MSNASFGSDFALKQRLNVNDQYTDEYLCTKDPTLSINPMEIYDDEELKFKIRFRFTEGYCDKQVTVMVSRISKPYCEQSENVYCFFL